MPKKRKQVHIEEESNDADVSVLHQVIPCREKQINDFVSLMGEPWQHTVPSIFVYGHASSGKSLVVENLMECLESPHVILNCVECYTMGIVYQEILRGLYQYSNPEDETKYNLPKKCDNMNDFVRNMKQIVNSLYSDETVYIVLSKADRLRERDACLIPGLLNLQELTSCNICVVLESQVTWDKFYNNIARKSPLLLHFPSYTKDELQKILCFLRPSGARKDFYNDYIGILLSVFFAACRDLRELRHLAELNYPIYRAPIERGIATESERHKLWKNIEPHLRDALHTVYLREISSNEWTKVHYKHCNVDEETGNIIPFVSKDKRGTLGMVELPLYSKFLLIAAYLASYNPMKTDMRFFVKSAGKHKKSLKSLKRNERQSAHLKGPKAFTLDRMMAIFYSIIEEKVPPTANIFSQITTLVSLQLLTRVGPEDQIDCPKYKCTASLDFVQAISKTIEFEVIKYLYDFV